MKKLTKKHFNWQTSAIERVQKVAVSIILSNQFGKCEYSYDMALVLLSIEPLADRRYKLCKTFARKTLKSRHADIFKTNPNQHSTRSRPEFFMEKCNTNRFFNSPINYLTRILNSQ